MPKRAAVQTRAGDPREVAAARSSRHRTIPQQLATLNEKQDRHADSEPLFRRALAIYEKAAGPEHPAVATLLNNLGQVAKVQGRYAEAEPEIRRSLSIREKVLGRDHPDVARSLNNHRRANFDILVAISLNNLALLYQSEGRNADALPIVERMIGSGRVQPRVAFAVLFAAQRGQAMRPEKALDGALAEALRQAMLAISTTPRRRKTPIPPAGVRLR